MLPDYLGDIKRILSITAKATPSGKFASDGQAQFSGVVCYEVLYSDFEGKLTHLSTSSDYDICVPVESDGYIDSAAEVRVANFSVRLTGPRKLVAKSIVSADVSIEFERSVECIGDAFSDGASAEVASEEVSVNTSMFATSAEREYAEEAERFVGIGSEDVEIIATSGAVRIIESVATDGGVLVKGELLITSIVRTESQPPFAIKKVVPFEETVSAEGIYRDMPTIADGYITSVTSGVADSDDGASLTVNAIAELSVRAVKNKSLPIVTDAYMKEHDTVGTYEDFSYSSLVCAANSESAFSCAVLRTEIGCEAVREILTLGCELRSLDKKVVHNGLEISGEAVFSGVACEINEENKPNYLPIKFTSPFCINVNCGCQIPTSAEVLVSIQALDADFSLDTDNLSIKCPVKVWYFVTEPKAIKRLVECKIVGDAKYKSSPSTVTVYYPEKEETLFEVAKRFHTTVAKIARDNELDEAACTTGGAISLFGVKKLIIR